MQRGLVDHRTANHGCAIALVNEAQSVEPGGPSGLEVPLQADFVLSEITTSVRGCVRVTHVLLPSLACTQDRKGCDECASSHVMIDVNHCRERDSRRTAVVHTKLAVNAPRVGPQGDQ